MKAAAAAFAVAAVFLAVVLAGSGQRHALRESAPSAIRLSQAGTAVSPVTRLAPRPTPAMREVDRNIHSRRLEYYDDHARHGDDAGNDPSVPSVDDGSGSDGDSSGPDSDSSGSGSESSGSDSGSSGSGGGSSGSGTDSSVPRGDGSGHGGDADHSGGSS